MAFIVRPKRESLSQLVGPIVVAVVGMVGAALAAWFAATATIRSTQMEGEAALALEREKFQFELVKLALGTKEKEQASNDLKFLIEAGLLNDPDGRMLEALSKARTVPRYGEPRQGPLERLGCLTCHSTDGTDKIGPTFKWKFGTRVALTGGKNHRYDEDYIRESLFEPTAKVADGYAPSMPTYLGRISEQEIEAVVAFIKALAPPAAE